jgi:hypothetical protein
MKSLRLIAWIIGCQLLCAQGTFAAPKAYQVTGPIVELTDKLIVVQKGEERWEIDRTAETKVTGELKVGQKVTVYYKMQATSVETKESKSTRKANSGKEKSK